MPCVSREGIRTNISWAAHASVFLTRLFHPPVRLWALSGPDPHAILTRPNRVTGGDVLGWIGKALGGGKGEDGIPEAWVKRLKALLAPLDKLPKNQGRVGLADDILAYVCRGDQVAVLSEVAQKQAVGEHLHILGYHYGRDGGHRLSVYEKLEEVPPAALLRWARVLAACASAQQHRAFLIAMSDGSNWAEALMLHSADRSVTGWSSQRPEPKGLSAALMESLLVEAGLEPSALLTACFATPIDSGYGVGYRLLLISDLPGYPQAVGRHLDAIRPLLLMSAVQQRLHMLQMLEKAEDAVLGGLAPELSELAVSGSKQVRAAAEAGVRRCGAMVVAPLKRLAESGKPEQRLHALRLLRALALRDDDAALRDYASATAQADKAPNVQALVGEWESEAQAVAETAQTRYDFEVPVVDWSNALSAQVETLIDGFWKEINESVERANKQAREHHAQMQAKGHKYALYQDEAFSESELKKLKAYLASREPGIERRKQKNRNDVRHVAQAVHKLAAQSGMTPVALFKVLAFFGLCADRSDGKLEYHATHGFNLMHRAQGRPNLIELSEMLRAAGYPTTGLLRNYCQSWSSIAADWEPEAVWPYFAQHLDLLVSTLLQGGMKDYYFDRSALFRAVASLPTPPATVINALFDLALGTGKNDRAAAQAALANLPGKEARIVAALGDGKSEVRAVAAQWLGRLRHAQAAPALEQALAKEKHDIAKGAMLDALQALGYPVERYLDRGRLASEAAKSLEKGVPKDLDWFPWNAIPAVRWSDSGDAVPEQVLRWMLVQATKQKSPEPNAVLRKYCAMFEPRDRERFGQFVLETWLREDVRPVAPDQAAKNATTQAQSIFNGMRQYPQYYKDTPYVGKSVEELTAMFLPACLRQPAGSAIGSKGLLAVAAACAAERAADPVARYLKEHYGTRAAQGKALIVMLAWVQHPSATQLMLSIGNRFRTKSFQEEATRQAELLAERNDWTLSELADRTMPSAGFDDTGTMELNYGARTFTARLLPDFKIELFNPEGKKIAALPEPRQDDDAELAKDAKKAFSTAKKAIKNIVDLQTDRLYEALCTERDWSFEDWDLYLNKHPIVRRLLQRLVWARIEEGRATAMFRPLDDGTLTDVEDNEVRLPPQARVRLAHDSSMRAEDVAKWQQHLLDYEIAPLFQQLGKGSYDLPPGKHADTQVMDFEGYLLDAFALRGRALKLGYMRGATEDGGWFYAYEKRFPTLGLLAVIEFTGNPLPEENRKVALLNLSFANAQGDSWQRSNLALSKVPKVLLSECYNDLRLIAAEGSGYDKDWQKKSEY
ncbi:MAG: DUF4132 domain-containing protein [Rhodocyclaceae bacterium]|nr:MAG: DUF4132 domain-containing protein [Rhodocyclaceae bacterium]